MYCPHCGRLFEEGARFCSGCGFDRGSDGSAAAPAPRPSPVPAPEPMPAPAAAPAAGAGMKYCAQCGASNSADKNFCTKCGAPFGKAPSPAASPAASPRPAASVQAANPTPARYTMASSAEGCVSAAWRDVKSTKGWFQKSLLLGLMGMVPVLSWAVPGYALRWGAQVPRGRHEPMPRSVFADQSFAAGARLTLIGLIVVAVAYLVWALVNSAVYPYGGFYYGAYVRSWWPVAIGLIIGTTLVSGPNAAPVGVSVLFGALLFFIPAPFSTVVSLAIALFGTAFVYVCYLRATLFDKVAAAFQLGACGRAYGKGLGKLLIIVLVPSLLTGLIAFAFALVVLVAVFAFGVGTLSSYGGSYMYSSSSLFAVISQLGIGVLVALLLVGYVCSVCSAIAQLIAYRAMGHWTERIAPEWADEASAGAVSFGSAALVGQTFPTYEPFAGGSAVGAAPAPASAPQPANTPANGFAGMPVGAAASSGNVPFGGSPASGDVVSFGGDSAFGEPTSAEGVGAGSAPNDRETSLLAAEPAGARVTVALMRADGRSYNVAAFPSTVGKGTAANVCIDGNDAISRVHARISYVDGTPAIEDLGSKNGTYLNGNVLAQGELVKLRAGDQLRLGNETFTVSVQ